MLEELMGVKTHSTERDGKSMRKPTHNNSGAVVAKASISPSRGACSPSGEQVLLVPDIARLDLISPRGSRSVRFGYGDGTMGGKEMLPPTHLTSTFCFDSSLP